MLTVHSGPFHHALEDAFIARLKTLVKPVSRLLLVTPSSRLGDHVQLLVSRRLPPAAGIHFLTMSKLADPLVWEAGGLFDDGKPLPVISDPLFFDTLVKLILRSDRPFVDLDNLAVPEGFPPSVRSTLRDLMDAGVKPGELLAAVNEKEEFNIPEVDAGTLKQLIHLHWLYLERIRRMKVAPKSRILEEAALRVPGSAWLKSFEAVVFYGFYDLTGLQSTLFEAIARAHPSVDLFFPYVHGHPDHVFAARFREEVLHKVPHEEIFIGAVDDGVDPSLHRRGGTPSSGAGLFPKTIAWDDFEARVINVSGLRDEAWMIGSEILRLHDEEGIPFSEIGVVSRLRERLAEFAPVFDERGIPFVTSERPTLVAAPQIAIALELLAWSASAGAEPSRDLQLNPDVSWSGADVAIAGWAPSARWNAHLDWCRRVLQERIRPASDESARIWSILLSEMTRLADFDRLGEDVEWDEFLSALRGRWQQAPAPSGPTGVGVSLVHAEAARGLPFDVVFLAGLEERVFPRVVREDPFLRDPARRVIRDTIGYKIGQKMTALEEERLLLQLILASARRLLYVTFQRSDDEGKIVGASSFLRRLAEEWGVSIDEVANVVPRRLTDKIALVPPALLSRSDLFSGFLIAGRDADAVALAKACGADAPRWKRALDTQRALDDFGDAGPYDGLVGPEAGGRFLASRALSASALETFARCPFQFFVRHVLGLKPPAETASPEEMEARDKGTLVHAFLENFYRACSAAHSKKWPSTLPEDLFNEVFDATFAEKPAGLYPVLWDALRERLRRQLLIFLTTDFTALSARGLVPVFFEHEFTGRDLDPGLPDVAFQGIMDRIDVGEGRARVIDYKTGRRRVTNVATAVVSGKRVQPSLYILMAAEFLKKDGRVPDIDFSYLHVEEEEAESGLTAESFAANRAAAIETLKVEIGMIAEGRFPIQPGPHCNTCDALSVCRKNDSVSAYRAESSLEPLVRAGQKKAEKE